MTQPAKKTNASAHRLERQDLAGINGRLAAPEDLAVQLREIQQGAEPVRAISRRHALRGCSMNGSRCLQVMAGDRGITKPPFCERYLLSPPNNGL
jgi:hypothetical protein